MQVEIPTQGRFYLCFSSLHVAREQGRRKAHNNNLICECSSEGCTLFEPPSLHVHTIRQENTDFPGAHPLGVTGRLKIPSKSEVSA